MTPVKEKTVPWGSKPSWQYKLWKLEVGEDGKSLVAREDGGLLWEFPGQ